MADSSETPHPDGDRIELEGSHGVALATIPTSDADADNGNEKELTEGGNSKRRSVGASSRNDKKLTYWNIVTIQATYSSAGTVVMVPHFIGQWGYVLGPIMLATWMALCYGVACFICDVVLASDGRCRRFSDVGRELGGGTGMRVFQIMQICNLFFYLPNGYFTVVTAFQAMFNKPFNDGEGCFGYWLLIVLAIELLLLMALHDFQEASWLLYVSLFVVTVKAFVLIPVGAAINRDTYLAEDYNKGPTLPFGSRNMEAWEMLGSLVTYAYAGVYFIVETMADSKEPERYKSAMGLSFCLLFIMYIVPGLCVAVLWGYNVGYQINTVMPGAIGKLMDVFVCIPTIMDFFLSAVVVNDAWRRHFVDKQKNDDGDDTAEFAPPRWSLPGIWHQLKVVVPVPVLAFFVTVFVPNIVTFITLQTALTIVPGVTLVPSLFYLFGGRKLVESSTPLHVLSVALGAVLFAIGLATAINGFIGADWSLEGIWCKSEPQ